MSSYEFLFFSLYFFISLSSRPATWPWQWCTFSLPLPSLAMVGSHRRSQLRPSHRIRDDHGHQSNDFPSTSLHLGSTMTIAAGAKLFRECVFHRPPSHLRWASREREVTVGGEPRLLGEIQLPLYLRGDGGILVITIKRRWKRGAVGASNLTYLSNMTGLWE
jgi:hypothetical protein